MSNPVPVYFDPETVTYLRSVLDDAWARVPARKQRAVTQSLLAERILQAAATGERNRERLVAAALDVNRAA